MSSADYVDVVVVGGGVAGSITAAAFAEEGLNVLVCEAGLPSEKRLAGELMHPPAAQALDDLGLLAPLLEAGGVPSYGFAVCRDVQSAPTLLSYSEVLDGRPTGFAIDHHRLTHGLLDAVSEHYRIDVWKGRVTAADLDSSTVTVRRDDRELTVAAGLIVSAEGRASSIRSSVGIEVERGKPIRMVGWRVPGGRLPYPGYGHIFLGGPKATLAYQVSRDDVRVVFESDVDAELDVGAALAHLPRPFRDDVERAVASQPRQTATVYGMRSSRVTAKGKLAVVGDAGGCAHPLTATGITFCARDARSLAACVAPSLVAFEDVAPGLERYEQQRRMSMATRTVLAEELTDALSSDLPEMRLLRSALFHYWQRSTSGRRASLGLLSTHVSTPSALAREYARVCAHALPAVRDAGVSPREIVPAISGLFRRNLSNLKTIVAARRRLLEA